MRHAFLTPTDLGVTGSTASPVRLIIALGRGGGRLPDLSTLTHGETMVRLLSESPRSSRSMPELIAALRRLVCGAACYQLLRGRLDATVDSVAELLGPPSSWR